MLFISCKKENSVTIVEVETALEVGLKMTVNEVVIETDVVATYCQTGGREFLMIASKVEHLTYPLAIENFEEDDFFFFTSDSEMGSWSLGKHALGEQVTGMAGFSLFESDAALNIESNNGAFVRGTSEGILKGINGQGESVEYAYVIEFIAEIIPDVEYCENPPVEEPVVDIPSLGFRMSVNDVEVETEAFAAICESDTLDLLIISNREENLVWPLDIFEIEDGDFIFYNYSTEEANFSFGGFAMGEEITGTPWLTVSFSELNLDIELNDGEIVYGNASGLLLSLDFMSQDTIELYPYNIEFVAEIVEESDFCVE